MKRPLLGIAAASSFLLIALSAFAAEEPARNEIRASGSANILQANVVKARAEAVDNAMVEATVTASSEILTSEIFAQNRDVLTEIFSGKPKTWVQDYKVVSENRADPKKLDVLLSVNPNRKKLREELTRLGILFDRSKRPTMVMYMMGEPAAGRKGSTATAMSKGWTRRIASRLQRLGYSAEVVETIKPGQPRPWDIAVDGIASQYRSQAISFELHGVQLNSKADLGRVQARFDLEKGAELIAGMAAVRLLGQILPEWFRQTGEGKIFSVTVLGLKSYQAYKELKDFFNSGASGFTSAKESMMSQGMVTFDVMYDGEQAGLMKSLKALKIKGTGFNVTDAGDRAVRLEVK